MFSREAVIDKLAPFVQALAKSPPHDPDLDRAPPGTLPFVTIMRRAGAGGSTTAHELARLLNERDTGFRWTAFDRELVERVAEDHQISAPLVEAVETRSRNWIDRLLISGAESDFGVHHRVAETIRALAEAGGAIVVGRGGAFVTRDLPGGIHVRLVAPRRDRILRVMRVRGLSKEAAETFVSETDLARSAFYRNRWPGMRISAESFHVTFNTARVPPEDVARCVAALVPRVDSDQG